MEAKKSGSILFIKLRFYLRLTNDIAYDLYGIHYLTKSDKLIENLMNVLKQ